MVDVVSCGAAVCSNLAASLGKPSVLLGSSTCIDPSDGGDLRYHASKGLSLAHGANRWALR